MTVSTSQAESRTLERAADEPRSAPRGRRTATAPPPSPLTITRADGTEDVFEGFESKWTWNIRVDGCLEVVRSWWKKSTAGDSLRVREVFLVYNRDAWQQARGGDIRHFPVEATRASDL